MKNQQIKRLIYRFRHRVFTTSNLVVAVALIIAASWAWGSIGVLERNYTLQREIDDKKKQLTLMELQVATERFEQAYYRSDEYRELAAREKLGLVFPGEKVLILPENSPEADAPLATNDPERQELPPTNVEQWVNFFFGN